MSLCFVCFGGAVWVPGQVLMRISGRIVDADGKPVPRAQIQAVPSCDKCPIDVLESFQSDDDGSFAASIFSKTKYRLYIEEKLPTGYWLPIGAPSWQIQYLPEFKGILLFFRKTDAVDLGELKPTFEYVKTTVNLTEVFGRRFRNLEDSGQVKFRVKDRRAKILGEKKPVNGEFWIGKTAIQLALPKGIWLLDVFVEKNGKDEKIGSIKLQLLSKDDIRISSP